MRSLLPLPFVDQIPRWLKDQGDPAPLADNVDAALESALEETMGLEYLRDPGRAPSSCLDEMGYMFGAELLATDSDSVKREKIATAIARQTNRGLWALDVKPRIDLVSGASASIYTVWTSSYGWLVVGAADDPTDWMATVGGDGTIGGLLLVGTGTEPELPGNVYVDVGTAGLTAAQIAALVYELELDVVPAYFRMFLGYVSGGEFVVYPGGQIH